MGLYEDVSGKLQRFHQEQLLRYYEGLDAGEKQALLTQIDQTDFSILEQAANGHAPERGHITPLKAMTLSEIAEQEETFRAKGLELIRKGEVGAVLLAGGMGTRLGSDDPKGMYNIGLTKDVFIFQRIIENLLDVVKAADSWIHLFVMTSDKNHEATTRFLKEHDYFGYQPDKIHFFMQEMAPATDYEGKIYLEEKGRLATSPNGNGGWFVSMDRTGMLDIVKENGIKWLNCFAVDNVLQRIADPVFVGATALGNVGVGAKVVRKNAPDEKVGVMCLEDGKPSIVEYYELTDEMRDATGEDGERLYNFGVILNYLFSVDGLYRIMSEKMPLHRVEKKIPYIDAAGNKVSPESPNGYKYETLILDMIHEMGTCLPYEVVREKEFAPIKNKTGVDSVESARELCKRNGIEL
ncbi:MAG: UDPGP type 1 family protein [Lachnospiraceae bacterium]|nr:UDPGP type 1 family protein [Lachnospiraceae bacterium]